MDSPDLLEAKGIPCAFAEYLSEHDEEWERIERGIPRRLERIRSVEKNTPSAAVARVGVSGSRRGASID